jgi:hypothetical protein
MEIQATFNKGQSRLLFPGEAQEICGLKSN